MLPVDYRQQKKPSIIARLFCVLLLLDAIAYRLQLVSLPDMHLVLTRSIR